MSITNIQVICTFPISHGGIFPYLKASEDWQQDRHHTVQNLLPEQIPSDPCEYEDDNNDHDGNDEFDKLDICITNSHCY